MPDIYASPDALNILRQQALHQDIRVEYDGSNNPIYYGSALPGTVDTDQRWRIAKIVYSGTNPVSVLWAGGVNEYKWAWTDRGSLSYS